MTVQAVGLVPVSGNKTSSSYNTSKLRISKSQHEKSVKQIFQNTI